MAFDLPGQLVADRSGRFDLTQHARRHFQVRRKVLIDTARSSTFRDRVLNKLLVKRKQVLSSQGANGNGHLWIGYNNSQADCLGC